MTGSDDLWRRVEANKRIPQRYLAQHEPHYPATSTCPHLTGISSMSPWSDYRREEIAAALERAGRCLGDLRTRRACMTPSRSNAPDRVAIAETMSLLAGRCYALADDGKSILGAGDDHPAAASSGHRGRWVTG